MLMLDTVQVHIPFLENYCSLKEGSKTVYLPPDYDIRRTEPMLQVRGVVANGKTCLAYNAYGDVMSLSPTDCKQYVGTGRVFKATTTTPTVTNISDQPTQTD